MLPLRIPSEQGNSGLFERFLTPLAEWIQWLAADSLFHLKTGNFSCPNREFPRRNRESSAEASRSPFCTAARRIADASPPGLDVVAHTLARSSDGMVRHVPII
jgi:hypothetical protein